RAHRAGQVAFRVVLGDLDVLGAEESVTADDGDVGARALDLVGQGRAGRVFAAVVDEVGAGAGDLGGDRGEVLVLGVDVVGTDDLAAELLVVVPERRRETGAVGLLVVDDVGLLQVPLVVHVLGGEGALDGVGGGRAEVRVVGALLLALLPVDALRDGG